jgi:hypothetical protein
MPMPTEAMHMSIAEMSELIVNVNVITTNIVIARYLHVIPVLTQDPVRP